MSTALLYWIKYQVIKTLLLKSWTDAGPGVMNHDVRYRIAQKMRIVNADYFVRLHLSKGGSAHNEVERCQGYVGDAICDGGHWSGDAKKYIR